MEDLTAYLDRELSSGYAKRFKLHVDGCGPCNQELASLTEAKDLITANIRELTPRSELWDNIRIQIRPWNWNRGLQDFLKSCGRGDGSLQQPQWLQCYC